ncbi:PLP-dependent transferase [Dacryopinax primogenitus]|uniref:PLP-dependent transferase n=1 Tax=Dacryopinax primogenitus (strain DJM 731) TaxID=1858805 RepID=M5G8D9_DACPD|nr:PLP-dependent transferase [Dacryopinax primogenitus]EJU05024.1 PLP-dependent transferase [Dacryopinax primogenitus]
MSSLLEETPLDKALSSALERRRKNGSLRTIAEDPPTETKVDFSSNDYLGLSRNPELRQHFLDSLQKSEYILGSGASRLLDGNSADHIALEKRLAKFYDAPAALLFNSGYDANVGIFSVLPQLGDAIIYDELIHASVHDGMRASRIPKELRIAFEHNNVESVKDILAALLAANPPYLTGERSVFVAVESLYSMDGDFSPLADIVRTVKEFFPAGNGHVIVDEAHTNGLIGPKGRGVVSHLGLEKDVLVRLNTFGKGFGTSGAVVLASPLIRNFLLNYARPVIYTTALAQFNVISISCTLDFLDKGIGEKLAHQMTDISNYCRQSISKCLAQYPSSGIALVPSELVGGIASPIIPIIVTPPLPLALFLQSRGFMVRQIAAPTVPKGLERVRLCVHASNTKQEVDDMIQVLDEWMREHFPETPKAKL